MDPFKHQGQERALYHVSLGISDIERARAFYGAALKPLGYGLLWEVTEADGRISSLGWGLRFPELWTNVPSSGKPAPGNGVHVCFHAPSRQAVDEFHRTGLANGARDNGSPGYRPHYDAGYYGAFIIDPDGNKLEAMWFDHDQSDTGTDKK